MKRLSYVSGGIGVRRRRMAQREVPRALRALVGGTILIAVTPGSVDATTDDDSQGLPGRSMLIEVRDQATGQPVPHALLGININENEQSASADEQGRYRLDLPSGHISKLHISISRGDIWREPPRYWWYCEKGVIWESDQPYPPLDLPEKLVVELEPVTPIGGTVRDAEGNPLPGGTVWVTARGFPDYPPLHGKVVTNISFRTRVKEDGTWRGPAVPRDLSGRPNHLTLYFNHPDYQSKRFQFPGASESPTLEELRSKSAVVTMDQPKPPGVTITGRVLDVNDRPIRGARVGVGRFSQRTESAISDSDGAFKLLNVRPVDDPDHQRAILVVHAEGYATDFRQVLLDQGDLSVDFRLHEPQPLRGRVLDIYGQPIRGVRITPDQTIFNLETNWTKRFVFVDWEAQTDEEGRFVWDGAPRGEVIIDLRKDGYNPLSQVQVSDRNVEDVFTMHRPLRVSGLVRDAQTGGLIERFFVVPASMPEYGDVPDFWNHMRTEYVNGYYEMVVAVERAPGYQMRIEADGYLPAMSEVFIPGQERVTWDVLLERFPTEGGPSGVVRRPDGTPVAGAVVHLDAAAHAARRFTRFTNGTLEGRYPLVATSRTSVTTDEHGRFEFPYQTDPFTLAVLHDEGVAVLFSEHILETTDLTLQPLGRVEGVYRIGSKPGANQIIRLFLDARSDPQTVWGSVGFAYRVETDESGRFVIEQVPPLGGEIGPYDEDRGGTRYALPIRIDPGETTHVTVGGWGPAVIGQFFTPPETPEEIASQIDWRNADVRLRRRGADIPEEVRKAGAAAQRAWKDAWRNSEEGVAYQRAVKSYSVEVEQDGSFRVEDVMPGPYLILVRWEPHWNTDPGEVLGMLEYEFEVPAVGEEIPDEPLDIGAIILSPIPRRSAEVRRLNFGDPALDFDLTAVDGKSFKLTELRGKFVLLKFWATWCGPCTADIPRVNDIHREFAADDRLVIIGLNLDADLETLQSYVEEKSIAWDQVHLGDWSGTTFPAKYGVGSLPASILIGPDGRVHHPRLRGPVIKPTIELALRAQPAEG